MVYETSQCYTNFENEIFLNPKKIIKVYGKTSKCHNNLVNEKKSRFVKAIKWFIKPPTSYNGSSIEMQRINETSYIQIENRASQ